MSEFGLPCLVAMVCATLLVNSALADSALVPGETILDRERPELDPLGMPLGAFRLYPFVDVSAENDSNIFAQADNEISDQILTISPNIVIESDWVRHSLDISAAASIARYQDNSQEDFEDRGVEANLTVDVSRNSRLRVSAQYDADHEERSSPDDVLGLEPTLFRESRVSAGFRHRVARVSLGIDAGRTNIDYDDVLGASGIVNNDDRGRVRTTTAVRAGYEIRPELDLFIQARRDEKDYDTSFDDNGINRDSEGTTIAFGVQGALTGSAYAEALIGYTERDYDDATLDSIDTPWFEARLIWNVTGLTSLSIEALRDVNETTFNAASGYTATRFGFRLDHELRRNVLIHVGAYTQTDKYSGIDRKDDSYGVALGARYMVNRYLHVVLEARQRERDSEVTTGAPDEFAGSVVLLGIRVQR